MGVGHARLGESSHKHAQDLLLAAGGDGMGQGAGLSALSGLGRGQWLTREVGPRPLWEPTGEMKSPRS